MRFKLVDLSANERELETVGGVQEGEDARNLTSLRAPRRPLHGNLRQPVRQSYQLAGFSQG